MPVDCTCCRAVSTLARQLQPFPLFRKTTETGAEAGVFANHRRHCRAVLDDLLLHSEPGDPFFEIPHALPGTITLTSLVGTIHLSGNEHFSVE